MSTNSQMLFKGKKVQYRKVTIYLKITVIHFSYLYFSLAGNIIVYTPDQGTNREKYLNHIIYQREENADSGGN